MGMKIALFSHEQELRIGLIYNNSLIDVLGAYKEILIDKGYSREEAEDTIDTLMIFPENIAITWDILDEILKEIIDNIKISNRHTINIKEIKLLPPIVQPQKVMGIALNYADLANQLGKEIPENPIFFFKSPSALIGHEETIILPKVSNQVDYEAELVVIIKDIGKNVSPEEAEDLILGYTIGNDITARDIQYPGKQALHSWSKSLDTFAPVGPWLVTKDEINDPHNLFIKLRINGVLYQDSNTRNMVRKIPDIISEISKYVTLYPGDMIFTGTPSGTGFALKPPRFLREGDVVKVEIEKIGVLQNPVRAEH